MQVTGLRGFNLSIQQARLWSLQGESQVYRAQCAVQLEGKLNIALFLHAFQCLVSRHAILRTAFYCVPGMEVPLQVVTNHAEMGCAVINLGNLSQSSQTRQLHACFTMLQNEAFDLKQSPLIRAALFRLSLNNHIFLISLPALCADDVTLVQCIAELSQAYMAGLQGKFLAEEPLQYVDISAWQDELLLAENAEEQRQYWSKIDVSRLTRMPLPLEQGGCLENRSLETKRPETFQPQVLDIPVEAALSKQVQTLAKQYGVSIAAWLLTCWQLVLWRLTDEADLIVGVACNGRVDEELINALGLYTRFVPIGTLLADDLPFEQSVALVNTSLEAAFEEQIYFTWKLLCAPTDNNAAPPFFPLSFSYDDWPASFEAGELSISLHLHYSCTEPFVLKLSTLHVGEDLQLKLHYDPVYISTEQVERLALLVDTLLQSSAAQPQAIIRTLPLLPATEQEHTLRTFSGPRTPFSEQVLHQLFEEQAKRYPGQLAMISDDEQLTYQELNCQANQLAHVLRQRGVGPNVLVGLCVSRSAHMLVGLLAILKAGGAYVPLDPESPPARLAYQLQDIQSPLLVTQQTLLSHLPDWDGQTLCLETIREEVAQAAKINPPVLNVPQDLAYVIYTSGSTGMPKGVMISHSSLVNYTLALCRVLEGERGWQYATVSTLSADLGNTAIFCALSSGGCLQIPGYDTITSGEAFARWIAQHPVDVLKIVPSHLSALLISEQAQGILPRQALVLGGEILPPGLVERLGELGGSCRVFNHYGPTETTIGVLVNVLGVLEPEAGRKEREERKGGSIALGRPIANTQAFVLSRGLQIMPVGVIGELYIGGAGLALGYLHQPEQTAQRFVPHPFGGHPGGRLYRTGDRAWYTHQGQIEFAGRRDNQVKLRGYRIELGEIEAILRRHANVWDAVVVLREDIPGDPRLVGYVVPRNQPGPTPEKLREFVKEYVPEYMVPSMFVLLEALPLTTNGKVDRQQLPRPEQNQGNEMSERVQPRSPIEEILLEIWRDLLAITSIGIYDNFFALGGHSLLMTQLIARVRAVLQVEVSLRDVFEAPTIAELAQLVEQVLRGEKGAVAPPLVPVARSQELPLSFAQQRLWFLDQLDPESVTYLLPRVRQLQGALNTQALERSLDELVRRHEILRTTFQARAGQPVQIIHPAGVFRLPLVDLRGLAHEERAARARWLAGQEAQQPGDLARGPLLRTYLLRLDSEEHVLLLTMHHIISDGWSNGVFQGELLALYQAFAAGQPSPLLPLPIQYADFALWQRQWLQGGVLEALLVYWKERMAGALPVLELPTDRPRPFVPTYRGAHYLFRLPALFLEKLKALSLKEGVTLFMTLLAGFQILLSYYSGQEDIVVATSIANRNRAELEGLVGFFVNTLLLRTDLSGAPTFREVLKRVREVCIGAYTHQDLPFELLVEALNPKRQQGQSPLFQVMFMLQNASLALDDLDELPLSPTLIEGGTAKFDLTLIVVTAEDMIVCVEYNIDLFSQSTIERMMHDYKDLLEEALENPDSQVERFTLEEEQANLIGYFNEDLEDY